MDNYFVEGAIVKNRIKITLISKRKIVKIEKEKDTENNHIKILFKLKKDSDGYPPVDWESIWATQINYNNCIINNLPFYIYDLSFGDTISFNKLNDEFYFDKLINKSSYSLIRVYCKNKDVMEKLKLELELQKCKWEYSNTFSLASIAIPKDVFLKDVEIVISKYKNYDFIEYEIACNRE